MHGAIANLQGASAGTGHDLSIVIQIGGFLTAELSGPTRTALGQITQVQLFLQHQNTHCHRRKLGEMDFLVDVLTSVKDQPVPTVDCGTAIDFTYHFFVPPPCQIFNHIIQSHACECSIQKEVIGPIVQRDRALYGSCQISLHCGRTMRESLYVQGGSPSIVLYINTAGQALLTILMLAKKLDGSIT